jgi:hypothetical protein
VYVFRALVRESCVFVSHTLIYDRFACAVISLWGSLQGPHHIKRFELDAAGVTCLPGGQVFLNMEPGAAVAGVIGSRVVVCRPCAAYIHFCYCCPSPSIPSDMLAGLPDGFRLDALGNVWTSAGDGVHCYNSDGVLLGKVLLPEKVQLYGAPLTMCPVTHRVLHL